MTAVYIIIGVLWAACTAGLLIAEATESVLAAASGGLIAGLLLALPGAFVAGGLCRLAWALRARRGRAHRRRGGR